MKHTVLDPKGLDYFGKHYAKDSELTIHQAATSRALLNSGRTRLSSQPVPTKSTPKKTPKQHSSTPTPKES